MSLLEVEYALKKVEKKMKRLKIVKDEKDFSNFYWRSF